MPLFVRTLSRLVQEPSLNYRALRAWFRVLGAICYHSSTLLHHLLKHRSVYFITYFFRRLSKNLSHPNRGPVTMQDLDIIAWKYGALYLHVAFMLGGKSGIILALKAGLLEALWKLSQVAEQHHYDNMDLFGRLLNVISTYSLYRSMQKRLEYHLLKSPVAWAQKIESGSEIKSKCIWSQFKEVIEGRIRLGNEWEMSISMCSNSKVLHNFDFTAMFLLTDPHSVRRPLCQAFSLC
jgi:hypothetical protein